MQTEINYLTVGVSVGVVRVGAPAAEEQSNLRLSLPFPFKLLLEVMLNSSAKKKRANFSLDS